MEAIRRIKKEIFDLVVTDIVMPEKEGLDIIMELRRDFPDVKIIAISGASLGSSIDYLSIAKGFGAERIFAKPFENKDFLKAVKEMCTESQPA